MRLDIHVGARKVAALYRERDEYVLQYRPDTAAIDFVSLTMPVREQAWRWPRDLHPFFRQNLPEGYLLTVIREEFGPLLDGTDLSLLAVVGGAGIGRVTVTPEGAEPSLSPAPVNIEELLTSDNTESRLAALIRQYARAAVSGVVPKFLAPGQADTLGKPTLRTSRHLIKSSDERTPFLGFNEHFTMQVLARVGTAPVAHTRMSADGRVLVVDRFDVDADGVAIRGVEDACSLLGLPPNEKYATTTERVLHATMAYVPAAAQHDQLERIGWLLLTNYVVRNADCHSKNVALDYSSLADVAFTPAYDIVTTAAYPRFADSPPALAIDGRKTWKPGPSLSRFFSTRLGIPPRRYRQMQEQLFDSATAVARDVIEAARNEPRWHPIAKQMLHAWNDGINALRTPGEAGGADGLERAIRQAGFSDPEPPDRQRDVIGRSELLAKPGRKR